MTVKLDSYQVKDCVKLMKYYCGEQAPTFDANSDEEQFKTFAELSQREQQIIFEQEEADQVEREAYHYGLTEDDSKLAVEVFIENQPESEEDREATYYCDKFHADREEALFG